MYSARAHSADLSLCILLLTHTQNFLVWAFITFGFVDPLYSNFSFNEKRDYDPKFASKCKVLSTFHGVIGQDDLGPVETASYGWADMMKNVIRIDLVYRDDVDDKESDRAK